MPSQYCSKHRSLVLAVIIFSILFFRLSTLEILDLVDTTESRYAAVATQMLNNKNYVTPMIPKGADDVPYLGKPPLHFWLMVESYRLFGIDEWTSRLPSFISLLVIIFSFFLLSKNSLDKKLALRASAVLCSSLLMFTLSGTVLLDVTLTSFVSLSIVLAFLFLENNNKNYLYAFWLFLALSVLVKGPAGIVFCALPLLGYAIHQRKFKSLFSLLTPLGIALFLAITAPWFYLSEKANPGFLRYFFLNENVLRYMTKDYGDLYGQGHVEPYGTALWMFALAFFPWTTIVFSYLFPSKGKRNFNRLTFSPIGTLAFYWMSIPIIFLIFIRQLHFGYLVPALPGAALWFAEMYSHTKENLKHYVIINNFLRLIILLCPFVAISFGADEVVVIYTALALMICFLISRLKLGSIEILASTASVLYLLIYLTWSPIVGAMRSTETVMDCIANTSIERMPEVTVIGDRSFSANWLVDAWELELPQPFTLSFAPDKKTISETADYVIQSRKEPVMSFASFEQNAEIASWRIYSKNKTRAINCNLEPWKGTHCCRYDWGKKNVLLSLKNSFSALFLPSRPNLTKF